MKKLMFLVLFFVIQIALKGQSFFYYSSTPDSPVGQGQTVLVTNGPEYDFSSIGWSYDTGHTVFDLVLGFTNRSTDERHSVQFHIPYPITDISEEIFWFSNTDSSVLFEETPAMLFSRYKYTTEGLGFEYRITPTISSASFIVHSIVFGEGGLTEGGVVSVAVDFIQVHGDSVYDPIRDYGVIRYNSDYPVSGFPVAIPEPSTCTSFLGIGAIGLVCFRRTRTK